MLESLIVVDATTTTRAVDMGGGMGGFWGVGSMGAMTSVAG